MFKIIYLFFCTTKKDVFKVTSNQCWCDFSITHFLPVFSVWKIRLTFSSILVWSFSRLFSTSKQRSCGISMKKIENLFCVKTPEYISTIKIFRYLGLKNICEQYTRAYRWTGPVSTLAGFALSRGCFYRLIRSSWLQVMGNNTIYCPSKTI